MRHLRPLQIGSHAVHLLADLFSAGSYSSAVLVAVPWLSSTVPGTKETVCEFSAEGMKEPGAPGPLQDVCLVMWSTEVDHADGRGCDVIIPRY